MTNKDLLEKAKKEMGLKYLESNCPETGVWYSAMQICERILRENEPVELDDKKSHKVVIDGIEYVRNDLCAS